MGYIEAVWNSWTFPWGRSSCPFFYKEAMERDITVDVQAEKPMCL